MKQISDVKKTFGIEEFEERMKKDVNKLYGFLMCTNVDDEFKDYIRLSWQDLNNKTRGVFDIFTLESNQHPEIRYKSGNYLSLREDAGIRKEFGGEDEIFYDHGIDIISRDQYSEVLPIMFNEPNSIILPGIAIFTHSSNASAIYIKCVGKDKNQLSEIFQEIINLVKQAAKESDYRDQRFTEFEKLKNKSKILNPITFKDTLNIILNITRTIPSFLNFIIPK